MLDGAWGVLLQNRGLNESDFRGERFADHPRDLLNDPGPAEPDAAGDRSFRARRVLRRRRRHHHDEHLHGDVDRPGRLRARGCGLRPERRRREHRPRSRRPGPLRRRFGRAAEHHPLAEPAGRRSRLPDAHVRPGRRDLRRADSRARRRRRRPAADRDDLRHAERQGGAGRSARGRPSTAALDQRHDRRSLGPNTQRPDDRRLLDVDRARRAADRRRQLRARGP